MAFFRHNRLDKQRFVFPLDDIIAARDWHPRGSFARIRACIAQTTREDPDVFRHRERIRVNNVRAFNERGSLRRKERKRKEPASATTGFSIFSSLSKFRGKMCPQRSANRFRCSSKQATLRCRLGAFLKTAFRRVIIN